MQKSKPNPKPNVFLIGVARPFLIKLVKPFWDSENKAIVRILTLFLFILALLQVALAIVITNWTGHFFNALEARSKPDLLIQSGIIIVVFFANQVVAASLISVKQRLQIKWRRWLTHRLIRRWMTDGRHYLLTRTTCDNANEPISEDIRVVTESAVELSYSYVYSLLMVGIYSWFLWKLSDDFALDVGLFILPIPGVLLWLGLVYFYCAGNAHLWLGLKLTDAADGREAKEAKFRLALAGAQKNALAITVLHGEDNERAHFMVLFKNIAGACRRQAKAGSVVALFAAGDSVLRLILPILVAGPLYILGSISLGALTQSTQVFGQWLANFFWVSDHLADLKKWQASVVRVLALVDGLDRLERELAIPADSRRISVKTTEQDILRFCELGFAMLNGDVCVSSINTEIRLGERVLIAGNATHGAMLFRAIMGLWLWGKGTIGLPHDPVFLMPPQPYLPSGTLRAAICYPLGPAEYSTADIIEALVQVGLGELHGRLDCVDNWDKVFLREKGQQLGVVKLLLCRPKWILMQQAMDSLDPLSEVKMLQLISQQLPDAAILAITNETMAEAFFQRRIEL